MKRFTGHTEPWGEFVDVKRWPAIRHPERYAGKELFIGSVTDPYQPLEETYGRTRALLEQMQGSGCKILSLIHIFPGHPAKARAAFPRCPSGETVFYLSGVLSPLPMTRRRGRASLAR